jgi:hypothetical protein
VKTLKRVRVVAAGLAAIVALPLAGLFVVAAQQGVPGSERVSRLQGTAFLGRRAGVVGATVLVREEQDASRMFITSTDEKGQFRIDGLRDGSYRVWVKREGYRSVLKEDISVRYPFRPVVEVLMEPDGSFGDDGNGSAHLAVDAERLSVSGKVIERDGEPIGDVRLRFVHPQGKRDPRFLRTGPDGEFLFDGLPAGRWRLEANGVGFLPLRLLLDLDQTTQLDFALVRQPASYRPLPIELMPPEVPIPPAGFEIEDE